MLALIDADSIAYRIGFATEDESESMAVKKTSVFLEEMVFDFCDADDCEGYLTGKTNYRDGIAKSAPYKGNRKAPKPKHLGIIREYMVTAWNFSISENEEADDRVGIRAYDLNEEDYIICAIDKDLNNIRGWHYNFNKNLKYYVSEEEAIRNFYTQLLTGDRVDNIPGVDGIGPKKAEKILKDCVTEQDLFSAVLEAYDGDILRMTEMGQLLWIRRKEGDLWQPPS